MNSQPPDPHDDDQRMQDAEASPTAGMSLVQRILHVGGRTNEAGYIEFGSVQAVGALVSQVLRDRPGTGPMTDMDIRRIASSDESRAGRHLFSFVKFARAIEAHLRGKP